MCEPILEVLLSLSCSGRMLLSASQVEILQQQRQLAQDAGMSLLVRQINLILDTSQLNSALLLRLVYVCDLVLRMQVFLPIQLNIDNK